MVKFYFLLKLYLVKLSVSLKKETSQPPEAASAPIPLIKCRFCKGDHWSAKCPHKDLLQDKINETSAKGIFKLVFLIHYHFF
jgi:hypothetical protein